MAGEREIKMGNQEDADWLLGTLASIVEDGVMSFGITLTHSGAIVSGQVISFQEYLAEFRKVIEKTRFTGETHQADNLRSSLVKLFDPSYVKSAADKLSRSAGSEQREKIEEPSKEVEVPEFIHLKSAFVYSSNIPLNDEPILWRAKLADVSGFSFGSFAPLRSQR
jgi:hypothetical protein